MTRRTQGYYRIISYRGGEVSYFTTSTQRRGVWSAVWRSLADYRADIVHITYHRDGNASEVAQVTSGGFWKFTGPAAEPLRAYITERQETA